MYCLSPNYRETRDNVFYTGLCQMSPRIRKRVSVGIVVVSKAVPLLAEFIKISWHQYFHFTYRATVSKIHHQATTIGQTHRQERKKKVHC